MTTITASEVNKLRQMTGAGMMDCKNALVETQGDFEAAVDYLRKKGAKIAAKRADREATEGCVIAMVNESRSAGVIVLLACETDFVAKGEQFQAVAAELLNHLASTKIGELDKFLTSKVATGKTVKEVVDDANAMLGENIELKRISVLTGSPVSLYLHKTSPDLPPQVGVLVQLKSAAEQVGRDIAQHIAAFAPQFVSRDQVPADEIAKERRLAEETAKAEGKPEASISKIVEGRVTGFVKEVSLLEQAFAKDAKKTVQQILDEAKTAVSAFNRFRVGQ